MSESQDPTVRTHRRLRLLAVGALAFIALEIVLLAVLPHDAGRAKLLPLVLADAALAAVVCGVLVVTLRKK